MWILLRHISFSFSHAKITIFLLKAQNNNFRAKTSYNTWSFNIERVDHSHGTVMSSFIFLIQNSFFHAKNRKNQVKKKNFLDLFWWKRSSSSGWYSKLAWNLVIDGWSCDLRLYLYVWHSLHFGVKIKTSFLKKRENVFFRLFQSESLVGSQLWCGHLMGPLKVTFFSFLISSLSLSFSPPKNSLAPFKNTVFENHSESLILQYCERNELPYLNTFSV